MILIIGINEFLGQALYSHLQENGNAVIGWDTTDIAEWTDVDAESKGFLDVELLSEKLRDVNIVINCASFKSYLKSDYHKLLKINVEGVANLVNACVDRNIERLIQMSHIEAFGHSGQEVVQDEEGIKIDSLERSFYGLSRFLGDLELHRGLAEGLRMTIFNCGYLLDQQMNYQPDFEAMLKGGFNSLLFGKNGYLFLEDAIKAVDMALQKKDLRFNQYILISEVMKHEDVLKRVAASKGLKLSKGRLGFLKRWSLGRVLTNGMGYSKDYLKQMSRSYDYNFTRLEDELKFSKQN